MSTCISNEGEYGEHEPGDWCRRCGAFNEEAIVAERDALRAQLDAMTVEWADAEAGRPDLISHGGVGRERVEERVRAWNRQMPVLRGESPKSAVFKRLVSPWTAAEDAEGVSDGQQ